MLKTGTRVTINFIDNTKKTYDNVTDIDILHPWINGGYLKVSRGSRGYLKVYQGTERVIIPLNMVKDYEVE